MSADALTAAGLTVQTATDLKDGFDAAFKGIYGESIGSGVGGSVPPQTSIGQEIAILTDAASSPREFLAAIYAAFDPDQAVTPQLQILCALTGTTQKTPTFSTVVESCIGVAGTVLAVGRVVTVTTTGTRFTSQAVATLALVSDVWAALTAYAVNDLIINGGRIWQVSVAGISSAGTPPTGTVGAVVTEGTVTWRAMANSTDGIALVPFAAEVVGPLAASAGTLVNIATPVTGWTSAYNLADADLGQALETEPALRARRLLEIQAAGGGPADSIRAAILAIPTVEACVVFVNDTDATNGDGLPPHSVEVLIQAPAIAPTANADLGLAVWRAVGGGIATYGTTTVTITDASGNSQTVKFTRPTDVPIYIALTVYVDAAIWTDTATVAAPVKSAIGTYFATFAIGVDVRSSEVAAAVLRGPQEVNAAGDPVIPAAAGSLPAAGFLGVANGAGTDGTLPYIGTAPAPVTSTTVVITQRQRATVDPANITVTVVAL